MGFLFFKTKKEKEREERREKRHALRRAERSTTSKRSRCWRITSSVCVPMDPVDPSMAILLFT